MFSCKYQRPVRNFLAVTLALSLTACGGGGGGGGGTNQDPPPQIGGDMPRYAFVVNSTNNSVSTFVADSFSGRMKWIGNATVGTGPVSIATDSNGRYAYIANSQSNSISQFRIETNGDLTPMATAEITTNNAPNFLLVAPLNNYLYVVHESAGTVSKYPINANGELQSTSSFSVGSLPKRIAINSTGEFAYVINNGTDTVAQFNLDANGDLSPMTPASINTGTDPSYVILDTLGNNLYVTNRGDGTISRFSIDNSGQLSATADQTFETGISPDHIAIAPNGASAYVVNNATGTVSQFNLSSSGALSPITPYTITTGSQPSHIVIDASSRYAYVSNSGDNTISQYTIDSSGKLTAMAPATAPTYSSPVSMALLSGASVKAEASNVYVTNAGVVSTANSQTVSQYSVGTNGSLSSLGPDVATFPSDPSGISIHPSGKYAYVGHRNSIMWQYNVAANGTLSPMETVDIGAGLNALWPTIHPTGQYVYVAAANSLGSVWQYSVSETTGALSYMTPDSVTAGDTPMRLVVDPAGRHAYAVNYNFTSNSLSHYEINADGSLLSRSEIPAGDWPTDIVFHPSGKYAYILNYDGFVLQHTVNEDGSFTPMTPASTDAIGSGLSMVLIIHPNGQHAYMVNYGADPDTEVGTLTQFDINADGSLSPMTPIAVVGAGNGARSIAIDPSGKYVYVPNTWENNVSIYTVQPDGTLSAAGSIPAGERPSNVAISVRYE